MRHGSNGFEPCHIFNCMFQTCHVILNHAIIVLQRKIQNDHDEKCYCLFLNNYQTKNHNSLYYKHYNLIRKTIGASMARYIQYYRYATPKSISSPSFDTFLSFWMEKKLVSSSHICIIEYIEPY